MPDDGTPAIEMIAIEHIAVVNPRVRNKKAFRKIVDNIADIGLKRLITVARRQTPDGPRYDLVCGQGRLEAFRNLGQRQIPAIVVDADSEDCLVMSLVENLARRQHRAIELLHDIQGLKQRGYGPEEIGRKTGLSFEYVHGVIRLLENGEHRLLRAVESGHIPISVAIDIAESDDDGVQDPRRRDPAVAAGRVAAPESRARIDAGTDHADGARVGKPGEGIQDRRTVVRDGSPRPRSGEGLSRQASTAASAMRKVGCAAG